MLRRLFSRIIRNILGTITHVSTNEAVAALTFDDGPHPESTPTLLDILDKYKAHATFFMVGKQAQRYPELVRKVAEAGHAIGNHSWDHPSFAYISKNERMAQIRKCADAIAPYGHRLFRPPYGDQILASRVDAFLLGYKVITWNVVAHDWLDNDSDHIVQEIIGKIQPGSIIVFHDSHYDFMAEKFTDRRPTLEAVEMLLAGLQNTYQFLTIPELFRHGCPWRGHWYQKNDIVFLGKHKNRKGKAWRDQLICRNNSKGLVLAVQENNNQDNKNKIKLSVVVPCLNAAKTIGNQLEAFANEKWSETWELIISDNGSTDETLTIVEEFKTQLPNLRVVDSADRRGAAHARNIGASAAKGEALAFCDADDEVGSGWLAAIGDALSKHELVASRFEHNKLSRFSKSSNAKGPQEDGLQSYSYPPFLPHSGGSGLGIRRSLFEAVGGFDESLLRLQDTDLCWRVQLRGDELHFASDAVVHVRPRNTLGDIFCQSRVWGKYNLFMVKKYRQFGLPKVTFKDALFSLIFWSYKILKLIVGLRHKEDLIPIIMMLGNRMGRIQGCLKYRTFAP